jgi:hypothetical protein
VSGHRAARSGSRADDHAAAQRQRREPEQQQRAQPPAPVMALGADAQAQPRRGRGRANPILNGSNIVHVQIPGVMMACRAPAQCK